MTFYFARGACSLASHIALEEVGAEFEPREISFERLEQRSEDYRRINPRMRVASLVVDGKVLTEEVAILGYIAARFPQARLMPVKPWKLGECLALMAYIASSVHIAVGHVFRPERYADDEATYPSMERKNREVFWGQLVELDRLLQGRQWAMGDEYSVCDPYLLVVYRWGVKCHMPVETLPDLSRLNRQMLARPAVQRAYARERHPLE